MEIVTGHALRGILKRYVFGGSNPNMSITVTDPKVEAAIARIEVALSAMSGQLSQLATLANVATALAAAVNNLNSTGAAITSAEAETVALLRQILAALEVQLTIVGDPTSIVLVDQPKPPA